MKPAERLKFALDSLARQEVPETVNLWPQLALKLKRKEPQTMKPALKAIWTIALLLLLLVLLSGAAYALYVYFRGDVGLEAVSRAGLVSEPNITAFPTPLPTPAFPPAVPIGEAQTIHGVTVTLDWVYLDDAWQAIGFSVAGLAEGHHLALPQLEFGSIHPREYSGAGMSLWPGEDGLWHGRYLVHQIVRDPTTYMVAETYADLSVTIPLLNADGYSLGTFHFTAPHTRVHRPARFGYAAGGNTYAVDYGGLEMRLDWLVFTPQETRAKICHQQMLQFSLRLEAYTEFPLGQEMSPSEQLSSLQMLPSDEPAEQNWHCVEAVFAPLSRDLKLLRLIVEPPQDAADKTADEKIAFVWSQFPWQALIPGIDAFPSSTIGETKITLLQVYVDALRMAVVFKVEGESAHQDYQIEITDADNQPFYTSSGGMMPDEREPNTFIATLNFGEHHRFGQNSPYSPREPIVNGRFIGRLKIIANPWSAQGGQIFTFDLNVPAYPVLVLSPAQSAVAAGLEMRLERLEISPSFTNAYLCYQKPSAADWMIGKAILQIGAHQSEWGDYHLIYDDDFATGERPAWATLPGRGRCVKVGFAVGHHGRPEPLTLTIYELDQSIPEFIPPEQIQAANEILRPQGIEVQWVSYRSSGGGGGGPRIQRKPEGMTDAEALRRFYDALGYYFLGEWKFTLSVRP